MQEPKPNQYYKLSLAQAIQDYQDGILTATGLIYYAIGIYRKPGTKLKVANIAEFCKLLKVSIPTFYRAIAKLQANSRIGWEAIKGLNIWLRDNPNVIPLNLPTSDSQICNSDSQICNSDSQHCDYSFLRDTLGKDSSDRENQLLDPSYSYQLFLQSLSI